MEYWKEEAKKNSDVALETKQKQNIFISFNFGKFMACGLETFITKPQQGKKRCLSFLLFSVLIIGIHPIHYTWFAEIYQSQNQYVSIHYLYIHQVPQSHYIFRIFIVKLTVVYYTQSGSWCFLSWERHMHGYCLFSASCSHYNESLQFQTLICKEYTSYCCSSI